MNIPKYKKLLSYIFPLSLRRWNGNYSRNLQLVLHRNELQLSTPTAIYSQGYHYKPLAIAFAHIKEFLSRANNILFLGCGLGSGLQILSRLKYFPSCTLVDIEKDFLELTEETAPEAFKGKLSCVCEDAAEYMAFPKQQFDMAVVDIFLDTDLPSFVYSNEFTIQCHKALAANGILVLNYIGTDPEHAKNLHHHLQHLYHDVHCIYLIPNIVFIAYKR
ncbi:hypothetical protein DBR32_13155 [Taibaiella sp. KBW10]|uniref:spermidine synthase n=1 Tax=Taibaiella sp. KBW10 TaxID=2153357 RepID=UPI000F5B7600|nr:methyltransferase domain-containing protein [Taibaiella sp. KBW10]RQO30506.1 hypothetical protein DBR32_13155 [Taibaiella sp. KBW10]